MSWQPPERDFEKRALHRLREAPPHEPFVGGFADNLRAAHAKEAKGATERS